MPDKKELFVYRNQTVADTYTPGLFVYDNEIICHSLEDPDRDLCSTMSCKMVREKKIAGITAIPYGRYEMVWHNSKTFGRVPKLLGVVGFSDILIHAGNWATDTRGCILPGMKTGINSVLDSVIALKKLKLLIIDNEIKFINVLKQK